ncbi:MAG: elongation factor 1-beta [Promethearchaeota archaeon]
MAKFVLAIIKVLPDSVDVDMDALVEKIRGVLPEGCEIKKKDVEPIAFGLEALRLRIQIPVDLGGGTEPVEQAIEALDDVQRVETEMVSLM